MRRLGALAAARLDRHEVSGSLGDLGVFLPLLLGMSAQNGLDFASSLFFAGLFHVVTGLVFAIPLAVQPMKAIAAVALTEGLRPGEILAAGATVSAAMLLLGLTGLVGHLCRVVPPSVVRGLQLGLGLSLVMKAAQMVVGTGAAWGADSYATAALAGVVTVALLGSRALPPALPLFLGGLALALWRDRGAADALALGFTLPHWSPPAAADFASAFARAALPQIPLTALNSVVAVCALSASLFPDRAADPRRVAVSVGTMNLVGAWFGAMPMCHGAGGLAGHYRFGARTNGSILFLGALKMAVAVLFGATLVRLCGAFPASVLAVMLAVSGVELGLAARDQRRRRDVEATLLTAGACLGLGNAALGFALGLALVWLSSWMHRGAGTATAAPAPTPASEDAG